MNKVTLVINNCSWFGKREFHTWLPAVPILTALLKKVCDFSIVDANVAQLGLDQTREAIRKTRADVVLISALSIDYQRQYHKIAELAKQALPCCKVLLGGVYATVLPEYVLQDGNIDFIIQGAAEGRVGKTVLAILENNMEYLYHADGVGFRIKDGIHLKPNKKFLCQTREMVKPDFSLLDVEGYFELQKQYNAKNYSTECAEKRSINIIASYGCPYNCFFCANHSLTGSHVVYRPIDDILEEIDFFVEKYHVEQISFMDDNVIADKNRALILFDAIRSRGYELEIQIGNLAAWDLNDEILQVLHGAGCTRIGISVESGSQRVLRDIIHKPLRLESIPPLVEKFKQLNIMMIADFIIGLPGETWQDIRNTFYFADSIDADLCNFNIAVPYPGTDLYRYMSEQNMLPLDFSFDETFYVNGMVSTDEFNPMELKILQAFEWERINIGTPQRKARAMRVLRQSECEIDNFTSQMRQSAIRFIKKHGRG